MAQILITKPGTLTKADRAKLRSVDVVAVEADDPSSVKLITVEGQELGGSDMLYAALSAVALGNYDGPKRVFVETIHKLLKAHRDDAKKAENGQ